MSAMSIDVWSEPLVEPSTNGVDKESEGGTLPSKRASLFLSDSEDDEDTGSRHQRASPQAEASKNNGGVAAPDASKLDALFAGLDEDEDVFTVEPALDVEKMRRQADLRVAASSAAARNLVTSLSPDVTAGKSGSAQDKDGKTKTAKKVLPKLDEERLLGTDGFPRLIKDSKNFKITGKGHEVADLERLFRMYHGWAHRMFPKFQFKDTVDRVEKLCRSRRMTVNMKAWKDEANGITPEVRHEITLDDAREGGEGDEDDAVSSHGLAVPPSPSSSRPSTPVTRPGSAASTAPSLPSSEPDNDGMDIDIDALLQEEEEMMREINRADKTSYKPSNTVDDDDDDDALWAATGDISEEATGADVRQNFISPAPPPRDEADDEELWDIAAEMEAQPPVMSQNGGAENNNHTIAPADGPVIPFADPPIAPAAQPNVGGDWDDMYA